MNEQREFSKPEAKEAAEVKYISAKAVFESLGLTDKKPKLEESYEILRGIFKEEVPNSKDPERNDFKFELDDGKEVILNSAGNLAYNMKFLEVGDYAQVLYYGKKPISKGKWQGTLSHNFEVNVG